jgi:hypothetical protein
MLTNFEQHTEELDAHDLAIIPIVIKSFSKYTKDNPIKAPEIVTSFNLNREKIGYPKKMTEPKLRKICNHIRSNGLLPLIATSQGYYVSFDQREVNEMIRSLRERANAINRSADGLVKFADKFGMRFQN